MAAKILIIDDEDLFREDLASLLSVRGYECETASTGEEGSALATEYGPDVVLCDIVMPGKSGIEVLDEIMSNSPETCVVMITAYGTLETAVQAFRRGAVDYINKPLLVEDVVQKIERIMNYRRLIQEVKFLRREVSPDVQSLPMVGKSRAMEDVFKLIARVAPTKSTVLISGESGTGKELVARAIHQASNRSEGAFVAINCAGVAEQLLESEFFGHVRGAFTGAVKKKIGFFELADGGTLFLDEISEVSLKLQSKLLRALEEREFIRVGETRPIPFTARIITSTNRNLQQQVEDGLFRKDLWFRIAVFEVHLPLLRERRSDIPLLVDHFVKKFNREMKRKIIGVENKVIRRLLLHSWPGNVRELRNIMERAMILTDGDYITSVDLPVETMAASVEAGHESDGLREAVQAYEREHIRRVLQSTGGNKEEAARRLRIDSSTLYRKMVKLSLFDQDQPPVSA